MDKSINNLFKMSFNLRNLIVFRRRLTAHNFQTSPSHSSNKEESKSIYNDLGDSPSAIFDYINNNQDSLSGQNCLEALRKLSQFFPKSSHRSNKLVDKKDLFLLCNELDKRTKSLDTSQLIETIQLLSKLGISSKSIIFQSLLRNIQTHFHSLTDQDSSELTTILSRVKKSDLTDSMKIALSMITQSRQEKLNLDIISLCDHFYKATSQKFIERNRIHSILDGISKYSDEIPAPTAKSIFVSLSKIPEIVLSQFDDLLKRIQDLIINQAHTFQYYSVAEILDATIDAQKGNNQGKEFYNEQLIDTLINNLLSRNSLNLDEGIILLLKLRFLGHFQRSLIDYLAFKCFEKPSLISKMKSSQLLQFVSGLALFDYKPPFWESMQQLMVENENLKLCHEYTLIRILCNLAILDSFPEKLIARIFQLERDNCKEIKFTTLGRFGLLYQLVKTLHPNYPGPWPSEAVLNYIFEILKYEPARFLTYPLLPALEKALGGSAYIKTRVMTKLGHVIDHVIVMRKGAYPIAINQGRGKDDSNYENKSIPFVEDIIAPPESQMVAILSLDSGAYLRNVNQPRGYLQASIKSLEALKYVVIPIYLPEWMKLNERDKIPFIMNQIRLKCPTDS
ncbi:uncharacterized protein LOC117173254 [Belonocnema kinseyi]|uniref:uncharacterized protein LOC117173254 n=1 Tax=Belonocnema kinseyi TaxID=2817044 RepID=UPI00143D1898|nr:uncharacterized protein LOC117173254 [Belonocnema kinseyi]